MRGTEVSIFFVAKAAGTLSKTRNLKNKGQYKCASWYPQVQEIVYV